MLHCLKHKITTIESADGGEKVCEQVLVTVKGLVKLSWLVKRCEDCDVNLLNEIFLLRV